MWPSLSFIARLSCTSCEGWRPSVHLINICCFEISQLAKWESLARKANLARGCKSSQLNGEDRMSFLITETVGERKKKKFIKKKKRKTKFICISLDCTWKNKIYNIRREGDSSSESTREQPLLIHLNFYLDICRSSGPAELRHTEATVLVSVDHRSLCETTIAPRWTTAVVH